VFIIQPFQLHRVHRFTGKTQAVCTFV
jgi:hypothetical protein